MSTGNRRQIPASANPDVRNAVALIWDELERLNGSATKTSVETRSTLSQVSALAAVPTGSGGGTTTSPLQSRQEIVSVAGPIAPLSTWNLDIAISKSCEIQKIETDYPAYVVIYNTSAARAADSTRLSTVDPVPGTGVMAEVITTTTKLSIPMSPVPIFVNGDSTPADVAYLKVVNTDNSVSRSITITITYIRGEA